MNLLYMLEKIRFPGLDALMQTVTRLGEETAFLVAALIVFWCIDKKKGYYLLAVGYLGTLFGQFLKITCRIPRPWVLDENFTIVESARELAVGYSFPSGHSLTAVGTYGAIAYTAKRRWVKLLCIAAMALVPFSRMYLGVHTPADVLTGAAISLVLIVSLQPVVFSREEKPMAILVLSMVLCAVAYLAYVNFWNFPADVDAHQLESAMKNAVTLFGSVLAVPIVYWADRKRNFPVRAVWWVQIIKVVAGLLLVLAVKEGLKAPLELVLPILPARALRYFLVVLTAGVLWPMSFPVLSRLGEKKE